MHRINGIKLRLSEDESLLKLKAAKQAKIKLQSVKYFKIVKKSLDARDKENIFFVYNVDISEKNEKEAEEPLTKIKGKVSALVVGAGPCGLFAALELSKSGVNVTVIERGKNVDERKNSINAFIKNKILDENCNIQFGEGGAGAFSDGKLNTQTGGLFVKKVLKQFVKSGAPEEIEYLSKPHIGSDNLPIVVKNLRNEIINNGGKFRFSQKLEDLEIKNGKIISVTINGKKEVYDEVVLCVGHSARDIFEMLYNRGIFMESKDFAVGVRIEHLQKDINFAQYGKFYQNKKLPVADYKLTSNFNGRGVFTFCMCPGGYVMPSSSEKNTVVTNGMSNYLRNGLNANSAVIAQVGKRDYGENLFDGVNFQKNIEEKSFILGGGEYCAPVQLAEDFISDRKSCAFKNVIPTYPMGNKFADISTLFPKELNCALKAGLSDMGKKLCNFDKNGAVITAAETRTSSPIRITRTQTFNSVSVENLYPSGEGAGYAGGITSAAADGIKTAYAIIKKYFV